VGYYLIGTDLGGTKIATALTDTDCQIIKYDTHPTDPGRKASIIVEEMAQSILRVAEGIPREAVLGVGIACAGLITQEGVVEYSPNLGWCHLPLRESLEKLLPWRVYVQNDVNMAALGELHYGVAKGKKDVVCLFVGTGVGGGLIFNGRVYVGSGFAGEIGHTSILWNGPRDSCGNLGCVEVLASGTAMARYAREAIEAGRSSKIIESTDGQVEKIKVEDIADAWRRGDELAAEIVLQTGDYLAAAVVNLVNLLDPEMVVLGGGVIRGLPELIDMITEIIGKRSLRASASGVEVVAAKFGREAGVIGATVLVKLAGKIE
jgi:glucokinase